MKRIICLLCALLCMLTLVSCKEEENTTDTTDTTGFESEPVELTEEMIDAIMAWRDVQAWDITSQSAVNIVDDGDTENAQGYMLGFDGSMIKGEKGNMYRADTMAINSVFAFEIYYEMYYYDGWAYQIYVDTAGVEELNTYERYETTEEYFLADYDGVVPTLASEAEFATAEAVRNSEGIVVNVTLGDGRARDELLYDLDIIAKNNGVDADDIVISNAVVSYSIQEGKLTGYMASYTLNFNVGEVSREYSLQKYSQINAIDGDVEAFTLPEDRDTYEVIE